MKKFQKSDYALNKFSENIVYKFADGIYEVTPEMYLSENPDQQIEDFWILKKESDRIFMEEDRMVCRQDRKIVSFSEPMEHIDVYFQEDNMPEEKLMEKELHIQVQEAFRAAWSGQLLSDTQSQRLYLYIHQKMTFREIANMEGVSHQAVAKSIQQAVEKLKKFFEEG